MISTSGDTHLGGEDFDHRVMDYFMKLIKKKYKVDISKDSRALQKLRREAERAKRALSSQHQARALAGFPDPLPHPVFLVATSVRCISQCAVARVLTLCLILQHALDPRLPLERPLSFHARPTCSWP